jgi:8-amino-7-oxononanoate synthase
MQKNIFQAKLKRRSELQSFRRLYLSAAAVDFCSNDYLGIVREDRLASGMPHGRLKPGSTGSRLLSGNYTMIEETESAIARFHQAETGLIFNSGYDANLGLLSALPQKGDTVLYDYLSHASIRDGVRLSSAESHAFRHNDLSDLEDKLVLVRGNSFVVTESVFSMDGDMAPLQGISALCDRFGAHLIVDEAHATGVVGGKGEGLVQELALQEKCLARVHTFGKALGCHGAIVLGNHELRDFLINFSRPFIYTTALPEASIAAVRQSYRVFPELHEQRKNLNQLIGLFQRRQLLPKKLISPTAIQGVVLPGNQAVKELAGRILKGGMDVRPILYPTVPLGSERLRIILHSFNTEEELENLFAQLNMG